VSTRKQQTHSLLNAAAAILIALSTFSSCGAPQPSKLDIIGGTPVEEQDPLAKHVAAIVTANHTVHCSAVAIDTSTFLTAAHCIYGRNLQGWKIKSGLKAGDEESLDVISGDAHPKYDPSMMRTLTPDLPPYDLAVIKTAEAARSIIPVPIIRKQLNLFAQSELNVTVAGYGRTDGQDPMSTGRLRKASLNISGFNKVAREFTTRDDDGKMGCHVDSGAPAFMNIGKRLTLVGLVSRGDRKCSSGTTVFTDISEQSDYVAIIPD
jgi:hypothetical protein